LLDGVDLALETGEILMLCGDTGAGKSVLLRALARLDPLDAGQLTLDGQPASELQPAAYRARVTYLPQKPVMLATTVEQELCAGLAFAAHQARQVTRDQLIAQLALLGKPAAFLESPSDHLSGGEMQIVSLMRVLLLEPELLLLDEPTSATDGAVTEQIERLICQRVSSRGAAVWVTHDPAQAERVATRRLTMSSGRIS